MRTLFFLLFAGIFLSACKKIIKIDPPINQINAANIFTNDLTAANVLTGLYIKMSRENLPGIFNQGTIAVVFYATSLSSDELSLFNGNHPDFYLNLFSNNDLSSEKPPAYWSNIYPDLFVANAAIEGITASATLTPEIKDQLLGEAKFMRAFYLFYLVNFYGDIPMPLTSDYKINRLLPRSSTQQVYEQIVADLKDAQTLLAEEYKGSDALTTVTEERVRPNKAAATALLARVFLYQASEGHANAWENAAQEATNVIDNTMYDTTALSEVFLNTSTEAIWQLQPVGLGVDDNSGEGKFFVLPAEEGFNHPAYLSNAIVSSFELNDRRKSEWVGTVTYNGTVYSFPNKYKIARGVEAPASEYSTLFRLGEQYLIRAEARVHLGDVAGAQADLNIIRTRAGLPNTSASDESTLLAAIAQERKVELFTEGGHRWFDLKRTGQADAVLAPIKGSTWQTTDQLYPIPATEMSKSPSLRGHQNPGY
jgi:hypothetical protein